MRRDRTAIDMAMFALGACLLGVTFAAVALLVAGCSAGATGDCERIRSAINTRATECQAGFEIRADCDAANYIDGDVEACLAAVKAAACDELRQVARDRCLSLIGRVGP